MYDNYESGNIKKFNECIIDKEVYFYGAGDLCLKNKKFIDKYNVKGIFDDDILKIGKEINGIPILNPKYISNLDKNKIVIVITTIHFIKVKKYLEKMNIKNIFIMVLLKINDSVSCFHSASLNEAENISLLKNILFDEKSKKIVDSIFNKRMNLDIYYNDIYEINQYFIEEIMNYCDKNEIFIDAGAFNGDTIRNFIKLTKRNYKKIYAFEPDNINYKYLKKLARKEKNIISFPYGLSDKDQILKFTSGLGVSSCLDEEGNTQIKVKKIDNLINEKITFIKMDIEGAELNALHGAKNIIKKYKPKLAISIYHKHNDLWEIPFYIKSLVPEYKLYIRHHSDNWCETVCYAVAD